ncbi:MAG: PrgI family protein [Candidatus Sungbacteria bacterium]|nr:PrgI family protein [Candidatus Sungbacteria bacterium]
MQQFQVPQFINIEDRIVGPLTLKQFLYLLGGGAFVLVTLSFLPIFLFILLGLPVGIFCILLAFFKYNEQPFSKIAFSALNYWMKPKLYIWKNIPPPAPKKGEIPKNTNTASVPTLTESKLSDLAWSLDIKEKMSR